MKKIISFIRENVLFLLTIFLLIFIPLYPKIPLININNTWVYIRAEDFVVLSVLFFWLSLLFRKKVTLKTPLTSPILIFWIAGAISTIHGIVLLFPGLPNVFPNVAFLSFLRHIEYLSLFFVAYSSIRSKAYLNIITTTLAGTLFLVFAYGMGQRYLGFPAFLTMNEEFAKGIGIQLSALSRIPSTFAGHYDLAAYLVLVIPILVSLMFGFKNWIVKLLLLIVSILGTILLFLTVSRVSVFALLIGIFIVFIFQKKKAFFLIAPGIILAGVLLFILKPTLLTRFSSTISEVNVLVDAKTGDAIGEVKFVDSASYLKDKSIDQALVRDKQQVDQAMTGAIQNLQLPKNPLVPELPPVYPKDIPLVRATNASNGETLPQGTGYINLSLSPVTQRLGNFYYELAPNLRATTSASVIIIHGSFLVKRAAAYDLSFTTRFQGEWPRTILAFERNVFLGSGYGAVSLAVDNNYLRMLGEIGLFGITAFLAIFLSVGIYIKAAWGNINSKKVKSFVLGYGAGVIGLAFNATLIDVFEASKIAYLLWILTGIILGELALYQTKPVHIYKELKRILLSPFAIILYLLTTTIAVFSPLINNYFVGDDFTWLRWAASCGSVSCPSSFARVFQFFTDSQGFFFRPGTKIFFYLMYSTFWLNQVVYHIVSISLHFTVAVLFFLLARKILRNNLLGAFAAFLFLLMSGYSEMVFWIAATGHLFNTVFALLAILLYILWDEKNKKIYLVASILCIAFGLLFYEAGIVTPLLILVYKFTNDGKFDVKKLFNKTNYFLFIPIPFYLFLRFIAQSHWLNGDYSYNLIKLPFNFVGNALGYIGIVSFGSASIRFYELLRNFGKGNIIISSVATLAIVALCVFLYKKVIKKVSSESKRVLAFGMLFFIIALLPFLGLGNITSRYSYLASLGLIIVFVFMVKSLYINLQSYGRDISIMFVTILVAVFSLFHIIQVQQAHGDWRTAGNSVQNFFASIDQLYTSSWSNTPISLHFINIPIRSGEAWIFPVGLKDALWFTFRNENLKVYEEPNLSTALTNAGASTTDIVLKFSDDGSVAEVPRFDKNGVRIHTPLGQ